MALVDLNKWEQLVASYLPFVGSALDFAREQQTDKALKSLYDQADALAIILVQEIAGFLWWAAHIASAASDALGYSVQIQAALAKADSDILEAWTEWVNVKHPADLQSLYDTLRGEVKTVHDTIKVTQKANLKPLEAEIAALQKWRLDTVTPALKAWNFFYATWKDTYLPPIQTLKRWLKSPNTFSAWALPPLMSAAPLAISAANNKTVSTAIERALIATWTNDPQAVLDNLLQWLVSD